MKEALLSKTVARSWASRLALAGLVGLGALITGTSPWHAQDASAYVRGGAVAGVGPNGGYVAAAQTTVVPGVGVSHSSGVIRRFAPGPSPYEALAVADVPGASAGYAARSIRVGAITAGPSTGIIYRHGPPVARLPAGCVAAFWQGSTAYRCGATLYAYDIVNGATTYYPILDS